MARVTSKRQVTIPKAIAEQYGIASGDEIVFMPAGEAIRVQRPAVGGPGLDRERRLERFDQATERQQDRQKGNRRRARRDRGWQREDLYERGSAR
jgi:AbrB family looped-hinge helix DNA binding protein